MVGTDTSGDTELEVLGLLHNLGCQVARVEGSSDQDLSLELMIRTACGDWSFITWTHIDDILLEERIGAFLVV